MCRDFLLVHLVFVLYRLYLAQVCRPTYCELLCKLNDMSKAYLQNREKYSVFSSVAVFWHLFLCSNAQETRPRDTGKCNKMSALPEHILF